jgi:glc operon protein GlcG
MNLARTFGATLLVVAVFATTGRAQVAEKKTLTLAGAKRAIAGAVEYARQHNAPGGAIAVVDDAGHLLAMERLDGTFPAAATVSIGKARTAARFQKPTRFFEEAIRNGRTPLLAMDDFTPLQGGVLITVDGHIVGAIGVSGAASAQQDEELALAGSAAVETKKP